MSGEMEDQVCDWSTVHKPVGDLFEHVNLVGAFVVCLEFYLTFYMYILSFK